MRVELAFFDGDNLLGRDTIAVASDEQVEKLSLCEVEHRLTDTAAVLVLSNFADHIKLKRATLNMPIHDSEDWESIELGRYTLGFRCRAVA